MSAELKSLNFCYKNKIIVNITVNERNVCRIKRFNLLLEQQNHCNNKVDHTIMLQF